MDTVSLTPAKIEGVGVLPQREATGEQALQSGDPAVLAVTDFTREHPITVEEDRQIDAALEDMIRFGVRALLVLRERRIVGLLTSYDIQGERPLQFLQNSNYEHHRDIRVGHVMTPWSDLVAVDWADLQKARAGTLLEVLRHNGLSHLLVVERMADERVAVRGLASRARLERQLRDKTAPVAAQAKLRASGRGSKQST